MTHGNISSVFSNKELRNQIGLLMSILKVMSKMSEDDSDSIVSLCSTEIESFCVIVRNYTAWMFTGRFHCLKNRLIIDKIKCHHALKATF